LIGPVAAGGVLAAVVGVAAVVAVVAAVVGLAAVVAVLAAVVGLAAVVAVVAAVVAVLSEDPHATAYALNTSRSIKQTTITKVNLFLCISSPPCPWLF